MKNLLKFSTALLIIGSIACQNNGTSNQQSNVSKKDSTSNKLDNINPILIDKKSAISIEEFNISQFRDTVIIGNKGIMIYIPKDAFAIKDKGNITIKLVESIDLSDILLANFSTTSNEQLLETGGMIDIEAFSFDQPLSLKPDKTIIVHFPKKKGGRERDDIEIAAKEMNLFYAENNRKGINWVKDTANLFENRLAIYHGADSAFYTEEMESFRSFSNSKNLYEYLYAFFPKDKKFEDFLKNNYVNVEYSVNVNGKIRIKKIRAGDFFERNAFLNKSFENEIRELFTNIPSLKNNSHENIESQVSFSFPKIPKYKNDKDYNLAFEKKYFNNKTYDETELNYYIFSVSKLGLINCDRYPDIKTDKIQFAVNPGNEYKTEMKLIITDFKSISSSYTINNSDYVFSNIPKGLNIKIFIIQYRPDQTYYALKTSNTATLKESNFDFHPMTLEALKKDLEALN
jgi:hypothetical protein